MNFHSQIPDTLRALRNGLNNPRLASAVWLGKHCALAAWLGLLLAALTPPHGTGLTVCWFKHCTGLPCPGCGLTRSISCALHGMFLKSWQYHPMGLLILGLLTAIAICSLLPAHIREQICRHLESRAFIFNSIYFVFVSTFLMFGIARVIFCLFQVLAGSRVWTV